MGTTIYLVPSYFVPISTSPTGEAFPEAVPDGGRLRVDVEPAGVGQVYLDGYYVGSSDDFNHAMDIASGRHTIEIRADGYQALQDDIAVAPGRLVTYRGVLTRSEPASAPPPAAEPAIAAPTGPTTFYVIPGCYVGNVPPEDAGLPPGCDPQRAIAVKR